MLKIQFAPLFAGGDLYQTITVGQARYGRWNSGHAEIVDVPTPAGDLDVQPTGFADPSSPINLGLGGQLQVAVWNLYAGEGGGPTIDVGTAKQTMNIGGTFQVVPDPGTPPPPSVNLAVKGLMDGLVGVVTSLLQSQPPSASLNAVLDIQKLGSITASVSSSGTQTDTLGVGVTVSAQPGVSANVGTSVQQSTSGNTPQPFFLLGKVPVNTPLSWNLRVTLQATNAHTSIAGIQGPGCNAAWSILTRAYAFLIPQPPGGGADPFYSSSVFSFDTGTNQLSIAHPLAASGAIESPVAVRDDGTLEPGTVTDYSGFMPEVETILANGAFSGADGLLGSLLSYSGISPSATNADGTIPFTDGLLQFLDPSDQTNVLAQADLTGIVANPETPSFGATISNFTLINLAAGNSDLASELMAGTWSISFDPSIIAESQNFTRSATASAPFCVIAGPEGIV